MSEECTMQRVNKFSHKKLKLQHQYCVINISRFVREFAVLLQAFVDGGYTVNMVKVDGMFTVTSFPWKKQALSHQNIPSLRRGEIER